MVQEIFSDRVNGVLEKIYQLDVYIFNKIFTTPKIEDEALCGYSTDVVFALFLHYYKFTCGQLVFEECFEVFAGFDVSILPDDYLESHWMLDNKKDQAENELDVFVLVRAAYSIFEKEKMYEKMEETDGVYLALSEAGSNFLNDPQFVGYGLISVSSDFSIVGTGQNFVFGCLDNSVVPKNDVLASSKPCDKKANKDSDTSKLISTENFGSVLRFFQAIPEKLIRRILDMRKSDKYFMTVSFRFDRDFFVGKNNFVCGRSLADYFEIGSCFKIDSARKDFIAKLYDDEYDNLWVYANKTNELIDVNTREVVDLIGNKSDGLKKSELYNLTFEECFDENKEDELSYRKDQKVTQVVHLQYTIDDDSLYVNHIDHEYIFYTLDEFEARKENHNQKGEARPRFKTFKIDKARIPLVDDSGYCFLKEVLYGFFKNTSLIDEYFPEIS